ncbi:unnamed protein product [Dibothriocephalus latus]|uniref:Ras-GEF domain-containing protein n=1 Tax=Dibothriocephalus latus TaxID=60516 RepID=A0A3P7LIG3_DIBLA|nr:unnamed protein product [Dibothriocephalus latus]
MNNLYSAMSMISALQVECIYRLRHTWAGLGHRERSAYRRLEELFGQQDNCRLLREHTAAMRLPGIPYLGLYLSDLAYTNVAHPRINGQPTTVWVTKLNAIVDAIAHFQQSRFRECLTAAPPSPCVLFCSASFCCLPARFPFLQ